MEARLGEENDILTQKKWLYRFFSIHEAVSTTGTSFYVTRDVILIDLMWDCLRFLQLEGASESVQKDFLWIYWELIQETAAQGLTLDKALDSLRRKLDLMCRVWWRKDFLQACVDFLCRAFIQHYHLIVYALCHPRDENVHEVTVLVDVVSTTESPAPLSSGIDINTWTFKEDVGKLEEVARTQSKELEQKLSESAAALRDALQAYCNQLECSSGVGHLGSLVKQIVRAHAALTSIELEAALCKSKQILDFEVAKAALVKPKSNNLNANSPPTVRPLKVSSRRK